MGVLAVVVVLMISRMEVGDSETRGSSVICLSV